MSIIRIGCLREQGWLVDIREHGVYPLAGVNVEEGLNNRNDGEKKGRFLERKRSKVAIGARESGMS